MIKSSDPYFPSPEISRSLTVNLEKNFKLFSFTDQVPDKKDEIDKIFQMTVTNAGGESVSVADLLNTQELGEEDLSLFGKLGFQQLSSHPEVGVILEHPKLSGWYIKKNYGFERGEKASKRILKVVKGSDFPEWMLPSGLSKKLSSKDSPITIQVPNDVIHPLRVVMLRRGRKWIKQLRMSQIQAAKEYLCLIPGAKDKHPLCKRVVVLSKKEDVLSPSDNLQHYAKLAEKDPAQLKLIAREIVLFIQKVRLTDNHLNNFPFSADKKTVIAVDGEPVGGLADTAYPEMVQAVKAFDPGFYSLMGLKQLHTTIAEQMKAEGIGLKAIARVQAIFGEAIQDGITREIQERYWHTVKVKASEASLVWHATFFVIQSLYNYCSSRVAPSPKHKDLPC